MPRDLKKDLELCNKATKGPWYTGGIDGVPNRLIATTSFFGGGKVYTRGQDASPGADAEFIAAAREGWPEAIERAMRAEKALEIACVILADIADNCAFDLSVVCRQNSDCDKDPSKCHQEYFLELASELEREDLNA
jgi:hypothetical protein